MDGRPSALTARIHKGRSCFKSLDSKAHDRIQNIDLQQMEAKELGFSKPASRNALECPPWSSLSPPLPPTPPPPPRPPPRAFRATARGPNTGVPESEHGWGPQNSEAYIWGNLKINYVEILLDVYCTLTCKRVLREAPDSLLQVRCLEPPFRGHLRGSHCNRARSTLGIAE